MSKNKPLVALLTNNDDDIYCFRKELIDGILGTGYDIMISCPYGEKFELMKDYQYEYSGVAEPCFPLKEPPNIPVKRANLSANESQ